MGLLSRLLGLARESPDRGIQSESPGSRHREWMLWMHEDSGKDQIGRPVDIDGRTGKVVDGTTLKILVEWD